MYPFRSARRAYEVIYLVPGDYAFPMKNELTASDIASLTSAGGQLVFTGNRTDPTPSGTVSYTLSNPDLSYALVAFTTDGAGAYSRVEAWCPVSVGGPHGAEDAPLPMWAYAVLAVALLGPAMRPWSRRFPRPRAA